MPWLVIHGVTCCPSSSVSSISGRNRSIHEGETSSRYERWIRGFPFKSRIATKLAIICDAFSHGTSELCQRRSLQRALSRLGQDLGAPAALNKIGWIKLSYNNKMLIICCGKSNLLGNAFKLQVKDLVQLHNPTKI